MGNIIKINQAIALQLKKHNGAREISGERRLGGAALRAWRYPAGV